jgi:hypothetical protein
MAKRGLWDNIHAKRKRIKAGSGERMRKPGSKGAPTAQDFKDAQESAKDPREYGYEGEMVMSQLKSIMAHVEQLNRVLKPDTDLPEWVQLKITLAYDYLQTAADYLATEVKEEMACNSVGAGKVAGLGVGPQGEPPAKKSKVLKRFNAFTGK